MLEKPTVANVPDQLHRATRRQRQRQIIGHIQLHHLGGKQTRTRD